MTPVVAGAKVYDCRHDRLWVRFPPKDMKYLIFSFLRVDAKCGVDRRSTRHAFRIRRIVGRGVS